MKGGKTMSENKTSSLTDFMAKFKAKAPDTPSTLISKGGLLEYLKSPEGKERIRKAREEYQKKHKE